MGRTDGCDIQACAGPHDLRLVLRLKRDRVEQVRGAAGCTILPFRVPLCDLAGLDEGVGDVHNEFSTAYRVAALRNGVGAADNVELRSGAVKRPARHDKVCEALGMIVVHVGEENGIELLREDAKLRQPHGGSASCVELQVKDVAIIVAAAVTDQRAGAGQTWKHRRAALCACERDRERHDEQKNLTWLNA